MSVDKRRLAAAQRTAASRKTRSRARRLGAWIVIVPALAAFSFSVVAGAAVAQGKPGLAAAAAKVVPPARVDSSSGVGTKDKSTKQDDGTLVVVDSSRGASGLSDLFGKGGREVCWISTSQLARVSAAYRTTTSPLEVAGKTYSLITVYGADQKSLSQLLGTAALQCRLVHSERLFYLPFDPNLS